MSGEMSGKDKSDIICCLLVRAPGTQGAHKCGQSCRETAVPRSSSCAQHSLQVTGEKLERAYRMCEMCVGCELAAGALLTDHNAVSLSADRELLFIEG